MLEEKKSMRSTRVRGVKNDRPDARRLWLFRWATVGALLMVAIGLITARIGNGTHLEDIWSCLTGLGKPKLQFGSANGVFPEGCRWREVREVGKKRHMWAVEEYEFWNERQQRWTQEQPKACSVKGHRNPKSTLHSNKKSLVAIVFLCWCVARSAKHDKMLPSGGIGWVAAPRLRLLVTPHTACTKTSVRWDRSEKVVSHVISERKVQLLGRYNNGRWYMLVGDGRQPVDWWPMTRNQELHVLHVDNATHFAQNVDHRIVRGDTLIFDFVFFLHPTAIGHWGEMMFPLFSILREEKEFAVPPDQFLLLHLKRVHLMEWARSVLAATLGLNPSQPLPPIMVQQEQPNPWGQIPQPLEGFARHEWLCFERALVVRDILVGGVRTFLKQDDARAFRRAVYRNHGLKPPAYRIAPRLITYQRKRANRRIVNEEQFIKLLRTYAEVRVVEFDSTTPFKQQLDTVAATGVFVSVHTSNLANAQFLQPGSAVFEVIQRNWVWADMDRAFKVQTEMMGDIHHFAWRARHRNQTVYIDPRDGEKFGAWPPDLCNGGRALPSVPVQVQVVMQTEDCVEAHTNVDVVVNLQEFKALLDSRLPLVFNGTAVAAAEMQWPPADDPPPGSTGGSGRPSNLPNRANDGVSSGGTLKL